ncbi:tripartite tricarboxylate transporter TctB family protein [Streptomyces lonarensis]|uniref:Tripartite tricarboxylate transporter TctB family protein n=2 Tax=Streptomyces lonarensis TaxID=700599 RepID=A0A7X6D346_9ACTN|nr:tripartite tricarboxylate transporter TctB family protein [Streptomyces lonarensis]
MPALLLVAGVVLAIGTFTMDVPSGVASPGPQMFPAFISVACLVFAVLLAVDVLRKPEPEQVAARTAPATGGTAARTAEPTTATPDGQATAPAATPDRDTTAVGGATAAGETSAVGGAAVEEPLRIRSNRPAVLGLVGTVIVFIALLVPLGWIIAGALLFWGVARTLGSRRPVFDIFVAVAMSSSIQLAFSAGLGLNLPPGILAGVF